VNMAKRQKHGHAADVAAVAHTHTKNQGGGKEIFSGPTEKHERKVRKTNITGSTRGGKI